MGFHRPISGTRTNQDSGSGPTRGNRWSSSVTTSIATSCIAYDELSFRPGACGDRQHTVVIHAIFPRQMLSNDFLRCRAMKQRLCICRRGSGSFSRRLRKTMYPSLEKHSHNRVLRWIGRRVKLGPKLSPAFSRVCTLQLTGSIWR
jgi:hypothetical protein